MRWQALFDDLDAQFDAAEAAALSVEVSDRTRLELAKVRFSDRLRASVGAPLVVGVPQIGLIPGQLTGVGPDWLLLRESVSREVLIPLSAVLTVAGLSPTADDPDRHSAVEARLGLRYALRLLARDRAAVAVTLADGRLVTGTIDRVGADFIDVAEHPTNEPRRAVVRAVTLPVSAVVVIRSV